MVWIDREGMGISASFLKLIVREHFEAVFIDDALRQGCTLLRECASHRNAFVEFVKSESWKEDISDLEFTPKLLYPTACSVWGKYGYKEQCPKESSISSHDSLPPICGTDPLLSSKSDPESFPSDRLTIFTDPSDGKVLLLLVLYPLFTARNLLRSHNDSVTDFSFSSRSSHSEYNHTQPRGRQNRLQHTLLTLAASLDASDLHSYFTNEPNSFIDDYFHAVVHMPVRMMVCNVHQEQRVSPVSFANYVLNDLDKATMGLRLCEHDVVGQDLHVLYGNIISPGGARQLERAVFAGKTYKQRVELPNGHCKLLTICPVHHHSTTQLSAPFSAVSLESEPFPESRGTACWDAEQQPAEIFFQQIEDAMLLLPLLIRA